MSKEHTFQFPGGDSLTATALGLRLEKEVSIKLLLMTVFDATTIRRQAELTNELLSGTS